MTSFPLLESLAERAPLTLGQRIAVTPAFAVGRAPGSALVLPSSASRSTCIIEQRALQWWVRDLGSVDGVFYNGARLTGLGIELRHQDVLELAPGFSFVFLQGEQAAEARNDHLEAAIAANPGDATRWQVYADWLLEHQNRPRRRHDPRRSCPRTPRARVGGAGDDAFAEGAWRTPSGPWRRSMGSG